MTDLTTPREARDAVRAARSVYVKPRFGGLEIYVKIRKQDAMHMLQGATDPVTDGMLCGDYGFTQGREVFLG